MKLCTLHFLLTDRITAIYFVTVSYYNLAARLDSTLDSALKNWFFVTYIRVMVFLQSYVTMPGVGLRETEIKRICQISSLLFPRTNSSLTEEMDKAGSAKGINLGM